jgi:hypothetical protein
LNRFCTAKGVVAAEAKTCPPGAFAADSAADQSRAAALGLFDLAFTRPAPGPIKTRVAAAAAKCVTGIVDRCRQLRATLRVAAEMSQILDRVQIRREQRWWIGLNEEGSGDI